MRDPSEGRSTAGSSKQPQGGPTILMPCVVPPSAALLFTLWSSCPKRAAGSSISFFQAVTTAASGCRSACRIPACRRLQKGTSGGRLNFRLGLRCSCRQYEVVASRQVVSTMECAQINA